MPQTYTRSPGHLSLGFKKCFGTLWRRKNSFCLTNVWMVVLKDRNAVVLWTYRGKHPFCRVFRQSMNIFFRLIWKSIFRGRAKYLGLFLFWLYLFQWDCVGNQCFAIGLTILRIHCEVGKKVLSCSGLCWGALCSTDIQEDNFITVRSRHWLMIARHCPIHYQLLFNYLTHGDRWKLLKAGFIWEQAYKIQWATREGIQCECWISWSFPETQFVWLVPWRSAKDPVPVFGTNNVSCKRCWNIAHCLIPPEIVRRSLLRRRVQNVFNLCSMCDSTCWKEHLQLVSCIPVFSQFNRGRWAD